jgi:hypothetical protein
LAGALEISAKMVRNGRKTPLQLAEVFDPQSCCDNRSSSFGDTANYISRMGRRDDANTR